MNPVYRSGWAVEPGIERLLSEVPWISPSEARSECFMSPEPYSYTYGSGRGVRTYTSVPFAADVDKVMAKVNEVMDEFGWGHMNGCFLNLYRDQKQALGWHADDFRGMDHTAPVVVVSFGEEREIWWRANGESGVTPADQRRLLENGSLFIMPPGMQHTHQHRIPKGDRDMGERVSLTFRRFL
jgi:alkylated DNA repair dioxygenase AlkB